jgi:hypothetical protein
MKLTLTMAAIVALGLTAVMSAGCTPHNAMAEPRVALQRGGLIDDAREAAKLEKAITDKDIARLLDADVRAKLPTKLAITKVSPSRYGCSPLAIDADELNRWEDIVYLQSGLEGVLPICGIAFEQGNSQYVTLRDLRNAAANMGCELLMVYGQDDSSVENYNDAAALYWTFVGLWTVPGNVLEHRTVMQAILVDVRTGKVLGTATGDAHLKKTTAAAYASAARDKLQMEAPVQAEQDLRKGVRQVMTKVVSRAINAKM